MNVAKLIFGAFIGALSMGLMSIAAGYLIGEYASTGGGQFISFPRLEELARFILRAFLCLIGCVIGAGVVKLNRGLPETCGIVFAACLMPSLAILFWAGGDSGDQLEFGLLSFVIMGTLTAAIVWTANWTSEPLWQ